jgi:hypothetical protein
MSDKSVEEIMAGVRSATGKARGETEQKSEGGGNVLKSLFSSLIYNSGGDETAVPAEIVTNEEGLYTDMPNFNTPEYISAEDNLGEKPFADIYAEAEIASPFSVDELDEMANSAELKDQPPNMKLVAVPFALKQKGVTLDEPIADAAKRDAALDGFALMLSKRAYRGRMENESKVASIENELKEIFAAKQAEIDALRADSMAKQNEYQTFLQRKSAEESRMAEIISPFLSGKPNPVTVGNTPEQEVKVSSGGTGGEGTAVPTKGE